MRRRWQRKRPGAPIAVSPQESRVIHRRSPKTAAVASRSQ
jgi:hypothetical protein